MKRGLYGLTILELMVVITLIVILSSLSIIWIKNFTKRHKIVKDIQIIFSTLNEARQLAFTRKTKCGIDFGSGNFSSLEVKCDVNHNGNIMDDPPLKHIQLSETYHTSRTKISFSKEGFTNDVATIKPSYSHRLSNACIKVSNTRIIIGNWDGNNCEL